MSNHSFFYLAPSDPDVKVFRFNPADYNTTYKAVQNICCNKVVLLHNGEVIIEFTNDWSIVYLFTMIPLHDITPDEIVPPLTAKEKRNNNLVASMIMGMFAIQIIGYILFFICIICLLFTIW